MLVGLLAHKTADTLVDTERLAAAHMTVGTIADTDCHPSDSMTVLAQVELPPFDSCIALVVLAVAHMNTPVERSVVARTSMPSPAADNRTGDVPE